MSRFLQALVASVPATVLLALAACSPTFNWRDVRPEDTRLGLLFPCKPDKAEKKVAIGGQPTNLRLLSCDAGDVTFAVTVAELGAASKAAMALEQWQNATLLNMRATPVAPSGDKNADATQLTAFKLPGAALLPAAVMVKARGRRADGTAVSGQALYFAQDSQVFQAVIYADKIPPEVAETFFASLKFE
ncbi:MAG: hypothetical protein V4772_16235 [Pseudomonadota bacterium]